MKDMQCPICKTECKEILIAEDQTLTFEIFEKELKEKLLYDKEDNDIYYENGKCKAIATKLRALTCLMYDCNPGHQFNTFEGLKRHLEVDHQKTFCKICLKGRLIFVRE